MNNLEKTAYILGLCDAIKQIEAEIDCVESERSNQPIAQKAATAALRNAALLVQDTIDMTVNGEARYG